MRKYIFLTVLIFGALAITVGCSVSAPSDKNSGDAQAAPADQLRPGFGENASSTDRGLARVKGTVADLKIGETAMITGASNQDGTMSASQIMLGVAENSNWGGARSGNMSTGTVQFNRTPSSTQTQRHNATGDDATRFAGQTAASGQIQRRAAAGTTAIFGEILKQDGSSLVLKVKDGGSKIVFFSDKTEIFIVPTSTKP